MADYIRIGITIKGDILSISSYTMQINLVAIDTNFFFNYLVWNILLLFAIFDNQIIVRNYSKENKMKQEESDDC